MKLKVKQILRGAAVIAALAWAGVASAAPYQFTLTGSYSAQFTLDSSPISYNKQNGLAFILDDVSGTFDGVFLPKTNLYFWNSIIFGGFLIKNNGVDLVTTDGPQLFTGLEEAPTFKLGTFALTEGGQGPGRYTLTIKDISAPVPEPETYAMLLAGMGIVGFAARRRKST
ncbi:FxDxF family PEP-CTERM protein [Rugamonas sp. CCM 8940]|uniref:FxDxF family PEP-CTERM protein n=1 Tax=Rugamonas sp. CCM 8940 TaxID=2765359 RepID=UPI0018F2A707|nr:FxDxF family PEP-CTERM protein [Rugamonas sp. CCM 8940]MBJ7313674.1 PEP-CTERM sorting domain-containing protein [Rugamonas sp. CCM 8940]